MKVHLSRRGGLQMKVFALPAVVGSIVLYTSGESSCVHRILVSGLPVSRCNGYRLQAASCVVEREPKRTLSIVNTHLFGYTSLFICSIQIYIRPKAISKFPAFYAQSAFFAFCLTFLVFYNEQKHYCCLILIKRKCRELVAI